MDRNKILFEIKLLREDAARLLKRIDSIENLLMVTTSDNNAAKVKPLEQSELLTVFLPAEITKIQIALENDIEQFRAAAFITHLIPLIFKSVDRPLTLNQIGVLIDYTNKLLGKNEEIGRHVLSNTLHQMKKNNRIGKMINGESRKVYYYSVAWQDENKTLRNEYQAMTV